MRVLQVANNLGIGGTEKLLLDSIPLYHEKGLQMDILLLNGKEYPFLKKLYESNTCDIISLGEGSVYNPFHIFKIIKYLKKYDVVHVHLFPALYWVAFAKILSFSKTKLVYTEHSTTNNRRNNFFFKVIDNFVYSFYNKIVSISLEVQHELKNHVSMHPNAFFVINNGVNISKIFNEKCYSKSDLGYNIDEDDKLILQVSRFDYPKDQKTVIKAIKNLPENVKLLLVGEGEMKQECQDLAKELDVQDRVYFLGVRMDVSKLLKTADIAVLSTHFEGLSLSSIEGLASGKPLIASEAPGLITIVNNAGVMFPIGDDVALANEVNKLLTNEEYYNATVKKCLARAKEYDINTMVEKYIKLYESIV
ncbi:MAG: glycosyltransferase [Flavobacteriaceae bacterium]